MDSNVKGGTAGFAADDYVATPGDFRNLAPHCTSG